MCLVGLHPIVRSWDDNHKEVTTQQKKTILTGPSESG